MSKIKKIFKNLYLLLKIAYEEDKWLLLGYFFTSLLSVAFLFIVYFFYKLMIDQVFHDLTQTPSSTLFFIIMTYLLFEYISKFVNSTLNSYYFEYLLRSKIQNVLTRKFMKKLAELDFSLLENGKIRNLIAKVADSYTWRIHDNLRILNYIVYNFAAIIISFYIASKYNFWYFIILLVLSTPLYFLRAKYGNVNWSIYTSQSKKINYLWYLRYIFTEFPTLAEIKLYKLKDYFLKKIKSTQEEIINEYKKPILKYTLFSSLSSLVFPFFIFIALKNYAADTATGKSSIGDFTFFLNILYTFIGQISNLLLNMGIIYENNLYVDDYFRLQFLENKINNKLKSLKISKRGPNEIKFNNVSFIYPNSKRDVLKNINLTIKKGEDIAIVGHNGAGKTTLIKLLFRFYDPTSGDIFVDGVNLKDINLESWYLNLSVLFQDFGKYNLTLSDNIKLGNINNTNSSAVKNSIIQAQGADILTLKKGLDQTLGNWFDDGQDLSIGQWQKVAIARAIYRGSPILVLDEPTSNIDPQAEFEIFNNLKKVYKSKNIIFISHRFSTVRKADRIYVIEKGEIVESGTHKALLINNKLYSKFFEIQKKGYE